MPALSDREEKTGVRWGGRTRSNLREDPQKFRSAQAAFVLVQHRRWLARSRWRKAFGRLNSRWFRPANFPRHPEPRRLDTCAAILERARLAEAVVRDLQRRAPPDIANTIAQS